jgi:hypothetical protein
MIEEGTEFGRLQKTPVRRGHTSRAPVVGDTEGLTMTPISRSSQPFHLETRATNGVRRSVAAIRNAGANLSS